MHILIFKHNENKFKQMYNIQGLCPTVANQEDPEATAGQTYDEFPFQVKFSLEGSFLAVTLFTGEVKLLKMPPILNPL